MTLKPEHIVEALNKKTFDEIDPDEVLKHYGYKPEEVRCNGVGIGVWRKEEAFQKLGDIGAFMRFVDHALKGELTHGKIKTSVVQMIEGSLNAEPTIAPESLQPLTYNENRDYIDCDEFICHKCGIHVEDWKQIKIDPDDGEKELCEYTFKHCPECGAKVTLHKSCEFCRWHLRDGTCFNKHHSQPVTGREASCWNWEERE